MVSDRAGHGHILGINTVSKELNSTALQAAGLINGELGELTKNLFRLATAINKMNATLEAATKSLEQQISGSE